MELEVLGRDIHAYRGQMIRDLFIAQLAVVLYHLQRRRRLVVQLSDALERIVTGLEIALREPLVQLLLEENNVEQGYRVVLGLLGELEPV